MFDETDSEPHWVQVDLVGVAVVNGSTPRVARQVLQGVVIITYQFLVGCRTD